MGKECSRCGEIFPLDGFYRDSRARDGRQARCKSCANRAVRAAIAKTGWRPRSKPRVVHDPRACIVCGESFVPKSGKRVHCGDRCTARTQYLRLKASRPAPHVVSKCRRCAAEIVDTGPRAWCSEECRYPTRHCVDCGVAFRRRGPGARCASCRDEKAALGRAARLVVVQVWFGCAFCEGPTRRQGPADQRRYCSISCANHGTRRGGRQKAPPRVCSVCGVEWRPTDRPESKASSFCWPCRKPAPSHEYRNVKQALKKRLVLRECGQCQDCGRTADDVGEPLHAHHVVPQALGGSDLLDNLRLLCPDCHVGSGYERNHRALFDAGIVRPARASVAA